MTWRTKLADWISRGELTRARSHWLFYNQAEFSRRHGMLLRNISTSRREFQLSAALRSIADNTCCDGCQEAARVAKEALK